MNYKFKVNKITKYDRANNKDSYERNLDLKKDEIKLILQGAISMKDELIGTVTIDLMSKYQVDSKIKEIEEFYLVVNGDKEFEYNKLLKAKKARDSKEDSEILEKIVTLDKNMNLNEFVNLFDYMNNSNTQQTKASAPKKEINLPNVYVKVMLEVLHHLKETSTSDDIISRITNLIDLIETEYGDKFDAKVAKCRRGMCKIEKETGLDGMSAAAVQLQYQE